VAGRGFWREEDALLAEAAAAGLADAVELVGWVPPAELPAVLARADVAIYPFDDNLVNRTKSPVKLLELMASGLPVVADAVGEPAAVVEDGVSGRVVTPGDPDSFATAVAALLVDARRLEMGAAARARVASAYRWSLLADELVAIYRRVQAVRARSRGLMGAPPGGARGLA
jgi:glycosyltransferase involved in cell wall biosynthesis